ncbi:type VII secretion integral membrane protein EccD [Mycobacterium sp. E740]|nr:type VII secretion integral membrane protein EccD [Mycobacterium sp. E740]
MHVDGPHTAQTVDVALPSRACLGDMLPSLVELIQVDHRQSAQRWRLLRVDGASLDESLSLRDNEVRDGDVLWLTTEDVSAPVFFDCDASRTAARLAPPAGGVPQPLCAVASVVAAAVGAVAIICSARAGVGMAPVATAAGLSGAAILASVVAQRQRRQKPLRLGLNAIAVLMAAAGGAVAVPVGPLPAHLLLTSSAALVVAVLLLRLSFCWELTGIVTTALLCAAASGVATTGSLDSVSTGVLLATSALATFGVAARLAIQFTRLGPAAPDAEDIGCRSGVEESRVTIAHDTLTGIVAGAGLAALVGSVLVGSRVAERSFAAIAFEIAVGAAMLLRARTHIGTVRRTTLTACGFAVLIAGLAAAVAVAPQHGYMFGALACLLATGALIPLLGHTPPLLVRRAVELAEYAALAAVIPLGCWITGVFDFVRNSALT